MKVFIRVLGGVLEAKDDNWESQVILDVHDGVTVKDLLEHLGVRDRPVMVIRQECVCSFQDELHSGDELAILPVLAGG